MCRSARAAAWTSISRTLRRSASRTSAGDSEVRGHAPLLMQGQAAPEPVGPGHESEASGRPGQGADLGDRKRRIRGASPREVQVVRVLAAVVEFDDHLAGTDGRAGEGVAELVSLDAQTARKDRIG